MSSLCEENAHFSQHHSAIFLWGFRLHQSLFELITSQMLFRLATTGLIFCMFFQWSTLVTSSCREMSFHLYRMDIDEECVDNLWNKLKSAIHRILNKDNKGLCFSELYHTAYTLTQQRRVMKMYTGLKEIITEHLASNVKQHLSANCVVKFIF